MLATVLGAILARTAALLGLLGRFLLATAPGTTAGFLVAGFDSCALVAFGCALVAFGCALVAFGCALVAFGCALVAFGCALVAFGCGGAWEFGCGCAYDGFGYGFGFGFCPLNQSIRII